MHRFENGNGVMAPVRPTVPDTFYPRNFLLSGKLKGSSPPGSPAGLLLFCIARSFTLYHTVSSPCFYLPSLSRPLPDIIGNQEPYGDRFQPQLNTSVRQCSPGLFPGNRNEAIDKHVQCIPAIGSSCRREPAAAFLVGKAGPTNYLAQKITE